MMKPKAEFRIEGYWNNASNSYPEYPMPKHRNKPFENKQQVLRFLQRAQSLATVKRFKGKSKCRCCGEELGNAEYSFKGWKWPGGFEHYVQFHNVQPSSDFMCHVLGILQASATPTNTKQLPKKLYRRLLTRSAQRKAAIELLKDIQAVPNRVWCSIPSNLTFRIKDFLNTVKITDGQRLT